MALSAPAVVGLAALLVGLLSAPAPGEALTAVLAPDRAAPIVLVVAGLGLAVHVVAGWLLLIALLTLGLRAPAGVGRLCRVLLRRCAPVAVRRGVALALGTGLTLGLAGPAAAATATAPVAAPRADAAPAQLPPMDWPGLLPAPDVERGATARQTSRAGDRVVVVRPGDSLWELAARTADRPVTDAGRAAQWPRWWSANRAVVGDDPDRLVPGQRLVAPPPR